MLKYLYSSVTFQEVPDEITLCISISNCPFKCKGCHSPELWEDNGIPLTYHELGKLIEENQGISCVCFMGGDADSSWVLNLAKYVKVNTNLKVAWYTGQDLIDIMNDVNYLNRNFDYIKTGPYKEKLGGLNSPNTNQRFYKIINNTTQDITYRFNNENITKN